MLETYFNSAYQRCFVAPVVGRLVNILSANQITIIGCLVGVLVFPALYFNFPWLAIILLLLSGYFDTLDGALARLTHTTSNMGSVLDIVSDRVVELAVILGLFAVDPLQRGWLTLLMMGSVLICITSFLVVGIFTPNTSAKSFYYSPGLMERVEAFIFFLLMIIFASAFKLLAILFVCLVGLTAVLRLVQYYQQQFPSV